MSENLIIYYSRRGENYVNGVIKKLPKGNAELIAEQVQKTVGGDLFQIETIRRYSESYMTCIEEAKQEVHEKARPELKEYLSDISPYSDIFIVGLCWWGVYPMAMYTQLEKLDFAGKTVHFIVTHEGSGFGGIPGTIKDSCKGASIVGSFEIHGGMTSSSAEKIASWAKKCIER